MGIVEILTIIFVIAKLLGLVSFTWGQILLPEIICIVLYIAVTALFCILTMRNIK